MDYVLFMLNCVAATWRFLTKPLHQTLILLCLTVFMFGVTAASLQQGTAGWRTFCYIALLLAYACKTASVLFKEIKEVSDAEDPGPEDLPAAGRDSGG